MEVTEAENKEADQLSTSFSSSLAFSDNTDVAEAAKNDVDRLNRDKSSSVEQLGLISQQEYEAQFFGFTPKSFSDGCK